MTALLTAAQMREVEQAAIASGAVTGLALMERAGRGVVDAVFAEWPELASSSFKAVVLCGPGNNGGDGFVVARLLKDWGWGVEVFFYGAVEKLPPDARVNYERWLGMGEVLDIDEKPNAPPDLIVDAVFGTGLARPIDQQVATALTGFDPRKAMNGRKIVSVDVPSGMCSDSGKLIGTCTIASDLTVTFHSLKCGHHLDAGPWTCGKVAVVDIGLPEASVRPIGDGSGSFPVELSRVQRRLQKADHHKFGYGHALILSGGPGKGGAARMTARGALRIGAGLVTLGVPPAALRENAARLDAVMLREVEDAEALSEVLGDARINALCLGPGLGVARAAELLPVVLATRGLHPPYLVLDADALTALSRDPALFAQLHQNCVLTPHGGEFARLFPDIAERLAEPATKGPAYSKVDATRDAARRAGCVVLYKGADTVIADPQGRCSINSAHYDRVAPWLATAGSGDVLAGFITGLLARHFSPMSAAETAAWLHVECARSFGPGLIAEDLPEALPKVFRALGL